MSNPWFRMYSEFAHDPKVQMLSEVMQRRYVMLMCMRCSNTLVTLHETEIAFHLRVTDQELAETKALFIARGFINSGWDLLNWEKRQFASDTSASRVAKHRALQKEKQQKDGNGEVTLQKRRSNALDTDTDTDTENKTPPAKPARSDGLFEKFWSAYPRKVGKDVALKAFKKRKPDESMLAVMLAAISGQSQEWAKSEVRFTPHPSTWLNEGRWQDEAGTPATSTPDWVTQAGFENTWEANNARCYAHNASKFKHGKQTEAA